MDLNPAGGFSITDYIMPYDGSIVAIAAKCDVARTQGTATFSVYINGVFGTLSTVINAAPTNNAVTTQVPNIDNFVSGDRITVKLTTTGAFNATDGEATLFVHLN